MRAITVAPKTPDSVRLEELAEPDAAEGSTLVDATYRTALSINGAAPISKSWRASTARRPTAPSG